MNISVSLIRKLRFGLAIALSTCTCLVASVAQAQVGLTPMVIQEEISRNRAQSVLRVFNPSNQPIRVRVYAQPFTYDRDKGFTFVSGSEDDLSPYLQFSPREFVVPPGEQQRVRLIALFPPDLEQPEYRAIVFTEALAENNDAAAGSENATNIQTRIGSTVYVRQGEIAADLSVVSAQWNSMTQQIDLLVTNAGGATVRPSAEWALQRNGETVMTGKIGNTTVIAEGDRFLRLVLPENASPAAGTYELTGELVWKLGEDRYAESFSTTVTIP